MTTRDHILASAIEITTTEGLAAVSVRGVAARANIGASTLRHHFPSQAALHRAVVDALLADDLDDNRIADTSLSPALRLAECLGQFLPDDNERHHLDAWFALYAAAIGPSGTSAGMEFLAASADNTRVRVRSWLDALAAEDALRLETEAATDLALAVIDGLCLQLVTPRSPATPESAAVAVGAFSAAITRY